MNKDQLDASIPVLTEIIAQEQDFVDAASTLSPAAPQSEFSPSADDITEASEVAAAPEVIIPADLPPSAAISDSQWETLERKISERVLSQLQTRIDFVLEHRVRDSLADALQLAVAGVAAEIKRGLHHTLEDVISRAVAQEIARLQTNRNKPDEDSPAD